MTRPALLLAACLTMAACQERAPTVPAVPHGTLVPSALRTADPGTHRQYGTPVKVGDGLARAYTILDHGVPSEMGISLTAGALEGLPPGGVENAYLLPLPQSNATPTQLVELDWNPTGHPPVGVYTVPHFDFHFYTITLAERDAIDPSDPDYVAKATNYPTGAYVPPTYFHPPIPPVQNIVPHMGVHWLSGAAPELNGQPFTRTFIYGSWDGRFTFYEPMVTRAYLLTHPDVTVPIPVAAQYAAPGYYPTSYTVRWDAQAKEYHVALTGLVWRE